VAVRLVTDSTSYLSQEDRDRYGIGVTSLVVVRKTRQEMQKGGLS